MRASFLRKVAVGELVFLVTSLFSPLAEANLWQDRRAAQEKSRPVQLVSAISIGSQISGQLPAAAPIAMRRQEIAAPLPVERSAGALAAAVAAIPQNRVSIREVSDRGADAPVVVVLQDVHLNPEAQGNLSEAIVSLASFGGIKRVGVEGAFTAFDLRRVNGFPDASLSRRVADDFLAATLIAAPSHASTVLRRSDVEFLGVDSRTDYDRNVAAYRGSRAQDSALRATISSLKGRLADVKARLFGPEMKKLDRLFAGHESGSVPLGVYLGQLSTLAGTSGPNVDRLVEAYTLETSLDFARVDRERKAALERLLGALSPEDLKSLLDRTLAFRSGKVSAPAFYERIRELCASHGVPLAAFPALDRYVRYVALADAIDAQALASEQDKLEEAAVVRATKAGDERAAAIVDRRLALLGRLIDFALTPREWQIVDRDSAAIGGVPAEIGRLAGQPQTAFELDNFLDFYRCADRRSETIVSRLLSGNTGSAALVVGGFHTPHLVSMLRARGCSVVVCSPKLTRVDGSGTDYLTIFSREKTPLEKLFSGEKLTLAPTSVNFTDPATTNRMLTEEAARMVELGVPGQPPSGVTAALEDGMAHVTVEGVAGSAPVDVFAGKTDQASGYEAVGKRTGTPGFYFVRSVRQAGLLRTLRQLVVDMGTRKAFWKGAAGAVALGIAGGVIAGSASSGLSITGGVGLVLVVLSVIRIWRRADIAGMVRATENQPLTLVPGVTRLAMYPAEGKRDRVFFRTTDNQVRVDAGRRIVRVDDGDVVVMRLAKGEERSLVSEAPAGSTVVNIRSVNSRGEALIAQFVIRAAKENLMAVTEGLLFFRSRAEALGFPAPEVTVSWNPRQALAGTRAQRALTGELRSAIRNAGSSSFRFNVRVIEERTGQVSSMVGRVDSARIAVDQRPTFPRVRWTENEWDKGPQSVFSRALNGMVWALPGAMFALFTPLGVDHVVASALTFAVIVLVAAVLLPMPSRSGSENGLALMMPTESRSLPQEADALALDYLVLAPTAGEGERLREMIRETFLQGYLDRVIYINDGEQPVKRDGKIVPHDLPILQDIKANGLPGLTPEQNDLLKRQLNFVSFPENQRKERAVRSTLYYLSYLYRGRLPKVTIIQDSDSYLIGDGVRAQLQMGAGQLINSQHVAMGVPIDGDVTPDSGMLAWGEALGWWIQGYVRRIFFFLDRFALVRKVLSRSVPGGMAFFKTDRLFNALERHSGNFEAGDAELSNLLVEADKEEDPNAKPIADLFKGVRLRTDLMATTGDIVRQKTRWLNALYDKDPAAFLGIMVMLAWAMASLILAVPPWLLSAMALVSVAPGVLTRLINGPFRSMAFLTKALIVPSFPVAVLMVRYTEFGGYFALAIIALTILDRIRRPVLSAGWMNPMTIASIPFLWILAGIQVLGFGVAVTKGTVKRFRQPELFRAPPMSDGSSSFASRLIRGATSVVEAVRDRVSGLFIRGATKSQEAYITDRAEKDRFVRNLQIEEGFIDENSPEFRETFNAVKTMTNRILTAAGLDPAQFRFTLIDNRDDNAFVITDHNTIFMNRGLLSRLLEAGEPLEAAAFVLAHEIVHIVQGREDADAGKAPAATWSDALRSRVENYADEYDADLRALDLMDKAGFSVAPASRLFQLLAAEGGDHMGHSHPALVERVRALDAAVRNPYYSNYFEALTPFSPGMATELRRPSPHRAYQAASLTEMTAVELASHLSAARTVEELMAAAARGAHYAESSLDAAGRTAVKNAFEARLSSLLGTTPAAVAFSRVLRLTFYRAFGPAWSGFTFQSDVVTTAAEIANVQSTPGAELERELGGLGTEELLALLSIEVPGEDKLDLPRYGADANAAQAVLTKALEAFYGVRRQKKSSRANLMGFVMGLARREAPEYDETTGSYESLVVYSVERLMSSAMSMDDLVRLALLVNDRHAELVLRKGAEYFNYPSAKLRALQIRLLSEISRRLGSEPGSASAAAASHVLDLIEQIPRGFVTDDSSDMKTIALALHTEAGRNPALRDALVERLRSGGLNTEIKRYLVEAEGALTGAGTLVRGTTPLEALSEAKALFGISLMAPMRIGAIFGRVASGLHGESLGEAIRSVFASGALNSEKESWGAPSPFDSVAWDAINRDRTRDTSDWVDARTVDIAARTGIPGLVSMPQTLKRLVVFHDLGGVLGGKELLSLLVLFQNSEHIPPLMAYLKSLENGPRQQRESEKADFSPWSWNEYLLRLGDAALRVSLGENADLAERELNNYSIGTSKVWESFPGEFTFGGQAAVNEWRDGGSGFNSMYSAWYVIRMVERARQQKPFQLGRGSLTELGADRFSAQFDFLFRSGRNFRDLTELIAKNLPPGAYRNHALYEAFNRLVLEPAGVVLAPSERFDLSTVAARVGAVLSDPSRSASAAAIRGAVASLLPLLTADARLERFNNKLIAGSIAIDRDVVPSDYETRVAGYPDINEFVPGGVGSQVDLLLASLVRADLDAEMAAGTFGDAFAAVQRVYSRPSVVRDRLLDRLAADARASPENILSLLALYSDPVARDRTALRGLEAARASPATAFEFRSLEGEVDQILRFFPEKSPMRDEILQQVLDEKARTREDVTALESLMLRHSGNIRTEEGAQAAVAQDLARELIRNAPAAEKRMFLLWLFGLGEKPAVVKAAEVKYGVRLDGLRRTYAQRDGDHYRDAGRGAREDFLKSLLYGETGLLVVEAERRSFLEQLFDGVMPADAGSRPEMRALLRASFMAAFERSDQYQREETLLALLGGLSVSADGTRTRLNEATGAKVFLQSLGLIGVKVGQFIASSGYASPELRAALEDLKDQARPIYKGIVFAMVGKLASLFKSRPVEIQELLGTASVKVVYKVLLENGRSAVLKVKRPDVEKKIGDDMRLLRRIFTDIRPEMEAAGLRIPDSVVDTIEAGIRRELDFQAEADNQKTIDANIRGRRIPLLQRLIAFVAGRGWTSIGIADPKQTEVVGRDIIVESFVPGTALKDEAALMASGVNVRRVKRDLALELFRQIFIDGVYHADLHGANVRITSGGRAFLIDLGAVESISASNRQLLFNLFRAMAISDGDRALDVVRRAFPADAAAVEAQSAKIREIATSDLNPAEKTFGIWSALLQGGVAIPSELLAANVALGKAAYLFEDLGTRTGAALLVTRPAGAPSTSRLGNLLRRIGLIGLFLGIFFGFTSTASAATGPVSLTAAASSLLPAAVGATLPYVSGLLLVVFGAILVLNVIVALSRSTKLNRSDFIYWVFKAPLWENGAIVGSSILLELTLRAFNVFSFPFLGTIVSYAVVGAVFNLAHVVNGRFRGQEKKWNFRPLATLAALYVAFSVIFLQFESLLISFPLVFIMHGPAWNLLRMNLKALFKLDTDWVPLASISSFGMGAAGAITRERAESFARSLTEIYEITATNPLRGADVFDVLQAVADRSIDIDRRFAANPRVLAWIQKIRAEYPDMPRFSSLELSTRYAPVDALFDADGEAVVLTGRSGAGKGSLTKAMNDMTRGNELAVGAEDFTILFSVGGHEFAASSTEKPGDSFRARAFGDDVAVRRVQRVGLVRAYVNMAQLGDGELFSAGNAGFRSEERLARNIQERTGDRYSPEMDFARPLPVISVEHALKTEDGYRRLAQEVFAKIYGAARSQGTPEQAVARRIVAEITDPDSSKVMSALIQILTEGTPQSQSVGQTTQSAAPVATLDPMKIAVAVAAELKDRNVPIAQAEPAIDLIAALLSNGARANDNTMGMDDARLLKTNAPAASAKEVLSPTDVFKWLEPAPGKAAVDAIKALGEWRAQEHRAGDTLILVAPTGQLEAVNAAIQAAGAQGIVQVVDAELHPNALSLLRLRGQNVAQLVGTRRLRFLVRNDIAMSAAFFDLAAAGLDARVAGSLRSEMEIYLIVAAISQAVRIEPDMLNAFEAMRTVMIQA